MEKRVADLERIVHEQAFTLVDQARRLSLLEIDRTDAPPPPAPATELAIRPWGGEGISTRFENRDLG
jgi:hypothetical protein